jgi:hypothetical protein
VPGARFGDFRGYESPAEAEIVLSIGYETPVTVQAAKDQGKIAEFTACNTVATTKSRDSRLATLLQRPKHEFHDLQQCCNDQNESFTACNNVATTKTEVSRLATMLQRTL